MSSIPLILLHGYHSSGSAFNVWSSLLTKAGFNVQDIFVGSYVTENNEITVDDIAEGFDRALRSRGMADKPFDVVVHSTGMLVLRSWLTAPLTKDRQKLVKHLIALAPATFGSPVATKGRSLLGRIFLGSHVLGPDFLNSGTLVLENLELASKFTWDLAHRDLFGPDGKNFYDNSPNTPYVFIFDGTNDYGSIAEIFDREDQLGTDGIVRWSGVSLDSRKIVLDFTSSPQDPARFRWTEFTKATMPMIPIAGVHHNEILSVPPQGLQDLVIRALHVQSSADVDAFYKAIENKEIAVVNAGKEKQDKDRWQQFVVHAVDDRGNGIDDFSIEVLIQHANGESVAIPGFEKHVHPYQPDNSYRCFHVRFNEIPFDQLNAPGNKLLVRFCASSGTDIVRYQAFGDSGSTLDYAELDITPRALGSDLKLFFPFTTTLIEVRLNREPTPLPRPAGVTFDNFEIFQFLGDK
jgi:pimeloyl-ACP methyl ester carboxylesterase